MRKFNEVRYGRGVTDNEVETVLTYISMASMKSRRVVRTGQ